MPAAVEHAQVISLILQSNVEEDESDPQRQRCLADTLYIVHDASAIARVPPYGEGNYQKEQARRHSICNVPRVFLLYDDGSEEGRPLQPIIVGRDGAGGVQDYQLE